MCMYVYVYIYIYIYIYTQYNYDSAKPQTRASPGTDRPRENMVGVNMALA